MIGHDDARHIGYDVSFVGDMNGDGLDDIFLMGGGALQLLFGYADGIGGVLDDDDLTPKEGYRLISSGRSFSEVCHSAGDFNGDGFTDFIFGSASVTVDGKDDAGVVHVVNNGMDNLAAFDSADALIDEQIDTSLFAGDTLFA